MSKQVSIEWLDSCPRGQIRVSDGVLAETRIATGKGNVEGKDRFNCSQTPFRLEILVKGSNISYGKVSTIITVGTEKNSFSFFLRDASSNYPIYMPAYGVTVTEANDKRSYHEIAEAIRLRGLQSNLQRIQSEPEESFEVAAQNTRSLSCQTWLGLSRDMRIFALGERLEWIQPRFHGHEVPLPETNNRPCRYDFLMGRGWGAMDQISRWLEEGVLPILRGRLVDEDITYDLTAFVALETSPLSNQTLRGTHFLVADGFGIGHMFTKEQQALYDSLLPAEMNQSEETVFCGRITALNTSSVPRYAFFKNVTPSSAAEPEWSFDGAHGLGQYQSGRAFSVARLNGMPLSQEEIAVELKPGETATFELYLPHRPISNERALKLAKTKFSDRLDECRAFWKSKLAVAAQIDLPEQRIKEMIQAGLLHLDLITYGQEPKGTLTSTIGIYSAIGSESAPIIQFIDSMG